MFIRFAPEVSLIEVLELFGHMKLDVIHRNSIVYAWTLNVFCDIYIDISV